MSPNERLDELRRRLQKDPASIAFAQLAEELRRMGQYQEAVDVCRAGLAVHPSYLSARVTLGRALIELNQVEEARQELETVRRSAPENLAAIRALADIHRRWGGTFSSAPTANAHEAVEGSRGTEPVAAVEMNRMDPGTAEPLLPVQATTVSADEPTPRRATAGAQEARAARTVAALEQWLAAVHVARAHRSA